MRFWSSFSKIIIYDCCCSESRPDIFSHLFRSSPSFPFSFSRHFHTFLSGSMYVPKNGKNLFTFILVILIWNSAGLLSISSYKTSTLPTPATNKPIFSSTAVRPQSLQPSYFLKELRIESHSTQTVTATDTISVPGLTGQNSYFHSSPLCSQWSWECGR